MYLLLLSATCYLNTAVVVGCPNWILKSYNNTKYHLLNTKLLLHKNSWNQGEMFIKLLSNCFSMVTSCHVSQTTVTEITQEHNFDNCHLVVLINSLHNLLNNQIESSWSIHICLLNRFQRFRLFFSNQIDFFFSWDWVLLFYQWIVKIDYSDYQMTFEKLSSLVIQKYVPSE